MNCPCQSGERYARCCGRFISHQALPANARELMRSRYSAYVMRNPDYLIETWHPDFCPAELQLEAGVKWLKLDILDFDEQGDTASVEFEARVLVANSVEVMREKSDFVRRQGRWLYTSGTLLTPAKKPWKPGRNERCPCASGLKFKRCCGK